MANSPNDRRQTESHSPHALVAAYSASADPRHQKLATRMEGCGSLVNWVNTETGEIGSGSFRCDVRTCSRCQAHKQRKSIRESRPWIRDFIKSHRLDYLFLTIGFRNVPVQDARHQLQLITAGFKQLQHRSTKWPGLGSVTSKEFTIGDGALIHFNSHTLIAVKPDYFRHGNYMGQPEWAKEIQQKFRLPYLPVVHVQKVRGSTTRAVTKNFLYILDYILKPQNFFANDHPEVGVLLSDALRGTRRISYSGLFRIVKANAKARSTQNKDRTQHSVKEPQN